MIPIVRCQIGSIANKLSEYPALPSSLLSLAAVLFLHQKNGCNKLEIESISIE